MIGFLTLVGFGLLFVWWVRRRRIRATRLAGLHAEKPVFFAAPPTRYSTRSKDHRL